MVQLDLAVFSAVISVWSLVVGGLLVSRWNRPPKATDLLWTGTGCILIGIGSVLYAARYFNWPYLLAGVCANICLLTGLTVLLGGVRAADAQRTSFVLLGVPGAIWVAACSLPTFRASTIAAVLLFSTLGLLVALLACLHLIRGGIKLRSKRVLLALWALMGTTLAIRTLGANEMLPGLWDRYGASAWAVIFLVMTAVSISAIGYVNLLLSDDLPSVDRLTSEIERNLITATPPDATRTGPQVANLWSLRVDRLTPTSALRGPIFHGDLTAITAAINAACPSMYGLRKLGPDHLVWLAPETSVPWPQLLKTSLAKSASASSVPNRLCTIITCGAAKVQMNDMPEAMLAADHASIRMG